MNQHTLELLEFFRIAQIIAQHCVTDEGRIRCEHKHPLVDIAAITEKKALAEDFLWFLSKDEAPILYNRPPLEIILKKIDIKGICLSIAELHAIGLLADQISSLHSWAAAKTVYTKTSTLCMFINTIPCLQIISEIVFSIIDRQGELRTIPTLVGIQKKINKIKNDIEYSIKHYCTDEKIRSMLQNPLPVLRNGRQVLAVRSQFKGRITGIIYEYSQSGNSFYIEPESVVLKNNELIQAELEYQQELHRLLCDVSTKLAQYTHTLCTAHSVAVELDCIAAAAQWGRSVQAVFPQEPEDKKSFRLNHARHPLLGIHAVPIDINLSSEDRVLIITGANTGGKTVTLKTAALFVLLNQTGWPIPAGRDTELPIFQSVACAIGDEQSMEKSLSTFSAYMQTVGNIITTADENSLIILDELGSGTDPKEGGALAMSVLDTLYARGCRVFVTSHNGVLKNYGYEKKGCVNASVSFNPDTLCPTHRIIMGIPGESRAIDIAEKNGVSAEVIFAARSYLASDSANAATLIQGLIEKHRQADLLLQQYKSAEKDLTEKIRRYDLQLLKVKQKEFILQTKGVKRLSDLFEQKQCEIENLIRSIREQEITVDTITEMKQFFADFKANVAEEKANKTKMQAEISSTNQKNTVKRLSDHDLHEGMEIMVPNLNRRGTIIRKEKKKWLVAFDTLKMSFYAQDLAAAPILHKHDGTVVPQIVVEADLHQHGYPKFELQLLGMRLQEAEIALQKQLDLALMHNVQEFSIVHGKGNGVLQTMVREKLTEASFVAEFSFARPEQGGTGKTIVRLR